MPPFDPTKTNIPGTNLPYSVPNRGTLPQWDKQIPTALQNKGPLTPIFTGSNTGGPTAYGGSMRWFDPTTGKVYNNTGTLADNQFTNASPAEKAALAAKAGSGGVLTTLDYSQAVGSQAGGVPGGGHYNPGQKPNFANYSNPTQFFSQFQDKPMIKESGSTGRNVGQEIAGVHKFGDGNYYYISNVGSRGAQPTRIPSQFIDPRASQGGQKLTEEGKRWLQDVKKGGSSQSGTSSFSPLNSPTNFPPYSPSTPTPRPNTPVSSTSSPSQTQMSTPSWAMSFPTPTPNANTSTPPLFSPPNYNMNQSPGSFPSMGNYFGSLGGNYGSNVTPNNNSPQWDSFIRQWLSQYSNGNQNS